MNQEDLTKEEREKLDTFKDLFMNGFEVKKKCRTYGYVDRVIYLSNDQSYIEWFSEEKKLLNQYSYKPDYKRILLTSITNIELIQFKNKISITYDYKVSNYIIPKTKIFKFADFILSKYMFDNLLLLKKDVDNSIISAQHNYYYNLVKKRR